jgi:hypothetical protein
MVHKIHIPVMGICYTADTPVRVAHLGITSVISLVDDGLLEEYRMAYAERLGLDLGSPQTARIGRIRSYLDFVADEVERKFNRLCAGRFDGGSDKDLYFLMLPLDSPLLGVPLKNALGKLSGKVLICAIERGNEVIIPSGDDILQPGHKIAVQVHRYFDRRMAEPF